MANGQTEAEARAIVAAEKTEIRRNSQAAIAELAERLPRERAATEAAEALVSEQQALREAEIRTGMIADVEKLNRTQLPKPWLDPDFRGDPVLEEAKKDFRF
jgi:hypothetical protein